MQSERLVDTGGFLLIMGIATFNGPNQKPSLPEILVSISNPERSPFTNMNSPDQKPMTLQEIDSRLSMLREAWLEAQPSDKAKWMKRIDEMLDERLKCMS